ncbi:MAG: hypothetical protein AAGK05_15165, partial [Pseudomonadota bacterium]
SDVKFCLNTAYRTNNHILIAVKPRRKAESAAPSSWVPLLPLSAVHHHLGFKKRDCPDKPPRS